MKRVGLSTYVANELAAEEAAAYLRSLPGCVSVQWYTPGELSSRWRVVGVYDAAKVDSQKTTPPGYQWVEWE